MAEDEVWQFPRALRPLVSQIIVRAIQVDPEQKQFEPIYVFDGAATNQLMEERDAAVEPAKDPYQAGEPLVRAGELSAADIELLWQERTHYRELINNDPALMRERLLGQAGMLLLLLLIVIGISAYTWAYERRVIRKLGRCVGMAAFLLGMLQFFDPGGRLLDRAAVDERDLARAEAHRGACRIHRHIAAAQDGDAVLQHDRR